MHDVLVCVMTFFGSPALPRESEWVPLELSFGMPLFSSELNRRVCQKIASHKLCSKDRYKPTPCRALNGIQKYQRMEIEMHFEGITFEM